MQPPPPAVVTATSKLLAAVVCSNHKQQNNNESQDGWGNCSQNFKKSKKGGYLTERRETKLTFIRCSFHTLHDCCPVKQVITDGRKFLETFVGVFGIIFEFTEKTFGNGDGWSCHCGCVEKEIGRLCAVEKVVAIESKPSLTGIGWRVCWNLLSLGSIWLKTVKNAYALGGLKDLYEISNGRGEDRWIYFLLLLKRLFWFDDQLNRLSN